MTPWEKYWNTQALAWAEYVRASGPARLTANYLNQPTPKGWGEYRAAMLKAWEVYEKETSA